MSGSHGPSQLWEDHRAPTEMKELRPTASESHTLGQDIGSLRSLHRPSHPGQSSLPGAQEHPLGHHVPKADLPFLHKDSVSPKAPSRSN